MLSPSRAGDFAPGWLSRPQAASARAARAAQAASIGFGRASMAARSLFVACLRRPRRIHAGPGTETGRLRRLEACDRGPHQLALGRLLEQLAQPLERELRLAPHPSGGAHLLQTIDQRGGL